MLHYMICMMFIMTVSSAEVFNETPRDELYPEGNDLAEPAIEEQPGEPEYWRHNQLLYKLMKSLQRDGDSRYEEPINQTWSELPTVKDPGMKKWFSVFNNNAKSRPLRKWKTKKGKGPLLCYFKLCSFQIGYYRILGWQRYWDGKIQRRS